MPQNYGEPVSDEIIPGLQGDRSETGQAYSRWLKLSSINGRHVLDMCCFACVSSVRALDICHVVCVLQLKLFD